MSLGTITAKLLGKALETPEDPPKLTRYRVDFEGRRLYVMARHVDHAREIAEGRDRTQVVQRHHGPQRNPEII